jgi:hypothetical protein
MGILDAIKTWQTHLSATIIADQQGRRWRRCPPTSLPAGAVGVPQRLWTAVDLAVSTARKYRNWPGRERIRMHASGR